jgi:hypothetical protein
MYLLSYYVPSHAKEITKEALFEIGAGMFENYEKCAFETLGTGQFRPVRGANPHIGTLEILERVEEYKVEIICPDHLIAKAVATLKEAHPYEEVAYGVFKMEEF